MTESDRTPQDRRIALRIDSSNLVVHNETAEKGLQRSQGLGVSLDMNEFGIRLQATEPIPLGERYRFCLAIGDEIVEALGQVVHLQRALNGTFEMGIEFLEISARHIETLRRHAAARSTKSG